MGVGGVGWGGRRSGEGWGREELAGGGRRPSGGRRSARERARKWAWPVGAQAAGGQARGRGTGSGERGIVRGRGEEVRSIPSPEAANHVIINPTHVLRWEDGEGDENKHYKHYSPLRWHPSRCYEAAPKSTRPNALDHYTPKHSSLEHVCVKHYVAHFSPRGSLTFLERVLQTSRVSLCWC